MKSSMTTSEPVKNECKKPSAIFKDYHMELMDPTSPDILLRYYLNGRRDSKPGNIVHQMFWQSVYAWLLPTDFFKFEIECYYKKQYMYLVVSEIIKRLGHYLFTRADRFLTLDALRKLEKDPYISQDSFRKQMAEFNKLFSDFPNSRKDLRPTKHDKDIGSDIRTVGYRMHPQRQYMMVVGIDPKIKVNDRQIDWPRFECKPGSTAS